ncbi:MAG TPA: hypothetical protein VM165_14945 [Planctomycetaceae bacterium]|nr:hypothetical protein [Planctomycetaceae bacterium]
MSIELAEKLKSTLTDKWVVVDPAVPELKRFAEWTGKVRTVNMNCRALVEFDGPVDIGWYDIDPAFLTVVDAPKPKVKKEEAKPAAKPAAAAAAPKPAAGGSPLDAIRAAGAAKPAAAAAPAAGKPSPLDLIRQQQAAKAAGGAAPAAPVATAAPVAEAPTAPAAAPAPAAPVEKPAAPTTAPDGRKLSPIEMIRAQGAAKR